jgi:hypothetical protein
VKIKITKKSLDELLKEATDAWKEVVETKEYRTWSLKCRTWTEARKASDARSERHPQE